MKDIRKRIVYFIFSESLLYSYFKSSYRFQHFRLESFTQRILKFVSDTSFEHVIHNPYFRQVALRNVVNKST